MSAQTSAARREEIQKRIQLLREQRELEQAAFDKLQAEHPEMRPEEVAALAKAQAEAAAGSGSLTLGDGSVVVSVGDYVKVTDDSQALLRAERGHFVPDPVKKIYLGERGRVVRVMPDFQGKPAVEICFADGAEKMFFAECLEVGLNQSAEAPTNSAAAVPSHSKDRKGSTTGGSGEPATAAAQRPAPEPLPTWDQLSMPHHKSGGQVRSPSKTAAPAETASDRKAGAAATAAPAAPASHTSSVAAAPAPAALSPSSPPPQPTERPKSAMTGDSLPPTPPPQPAGAAPVVSPTEEREVGLVPDVLSPPFSGAQDDGPQAIRAPPLSLPEADPEGLGKPIAVDETRPGDVAALSEMDNLLISPRENLLAGAEAVEAARPRVPPTDEGVSKIPKRCPAGYVARFPIEEHDAAATRIPRYQPPAPPLKHAGAGEVGRKVGDGAGGGHTRGSPSTAGTMAANTSGASAPAAPASSSSSSPTTLSCSVAGYAPTTAGAAPLSFQPLVLRLPLTSLEQVLAAASRALGWSASTTGKPATRLFNAATGNEIMWTDFIRPDTKLVATSGCTYSRGAEGARRPKTPTRRSASASAGTTTTSRRRVAATGAATSPPANEAAAGESAGAARKARTPRTTTPAPAAPAASATRKPIQIRVYENGSYEDGASDQGFVTVTVRPTYRTLAALTNTLTRELGWRDGKKVDAVYDASGTEIRSLESLRDGQSVIASAGDRFIIPRPNTAVHREAMQLARAAAAAEDA